MSKRLPESVEYEIRCSLSEQMEDRPEGKALRAALAQVEKALPAGDLYRRLEESVNACLSEAVDLAFRAGVQVAQVDALMIEQTYTE